MWNILALIGIFILSFVVTLIFCFYTDIKINNIEAGVVASLITVASWFAIRESRNQVGTKKGLSDDK